MYIYIYIYIFIYLTYNIDRQIDRQTDRQTDKQTDRYMKTNDDERGIMKTMFFPGYHHFDFASTQALGHSCT